MRSPLNVDDVIVDDVRVTSIKHRTRVMSVHAHANFRGRASKTIGEIDGFSIFDWDFASKSGSSLKHKNLGRPYSENTCKKKHFRGFQVDDIIDDTSLTKNVTALSG